MRSRLVKRYLLISVAFIIGIRIDANQVQHKVRATLTAAPISGWMSTLAQHLGINPYASLSSENKRSNTYAAKKFDDVSLGSAWFNKYTGAARIPIANGVAFYQGVLGYGFVSTRKVPISTLITSSDEPWYFYQSVANSKFYLRTLSPDSIQYEMALNSLNGVYYPTRNDGTIRSITPTEYGYRVDFKGENSLTYVKLDKQGWQSEDVIYGVTAAKYAYSNGLLTQISDAFNNTRAFKYLNLGNGDVALAEISDSLLNTKLSFNYDAYGRVTRILSNSGSVLALLHYQPTPVDSPVLAEIYYPQDDHSVQVGHFSDGAVKVVHTEMGFIGAVQYESASQVSLLLPFKSKNTQNFEGSGANVRETLSNDEMGNRNLYAYGDQRFPDLITRITSEAAVGGGLMHAREMNISYNEKGRMQQIVMEGITVSTLEWEEPYGLPKKIVGPYGEETIFEYLPDGRLYRYTNPQNQVSTLAFDINLFPYQLISQPGNILEWTATWSPKGLLEGLTSSTDTLTYTYYDTGLLKSVSDKLGAKNEFSFDLPTKTQLSYIPSPVSTFKNIITASTVNDTDGRHLSTTTPYGVVTTSYPGNSTIRRVFSPKTNGVPSVSIFETGKSNFDSGPNTKDPNEAQYCKQAVGTSEWDEDLFQLCWKLTQALCAENFGPENCVYEEVSSSIIPEKNADDPKPASCGPENPCKSGEVCASNGDGIWFCIPDGGFFGGECNTDSDCTEWSGGTCCGSGGGGGRSVSTRDPGMCYYCPPESTYCQGCGY